jgi:surface polysaccharide O-acyltransferase-like enzyme
MNQAINRKFYLDNLRAFAILLIFIFHIFIIYSKGDIWYIRGKDLLIPSVFIKICRIWLIQLLFAAVGISSRYSQERRSTVQYVKDRIGKLLLPFIFGVLLIVPVQPFLARIYFNGQANFLDPFTKITDLSGYDGAFTPAHLWFILFLFIISMVSLPFIIWYKNKGKGTLGDKVPLILVILMGLLPCIVQTDLFEVIEIDGKSILEYLVYFLLGYFFLSNDNLQEKLDKHRFLLLGLFVAYTGFMVFILDGEFYELASWLAILAILGLARHYLNFSGKITGYLSKSSFGIYIFHQSWIVITAFFIFRATDNPALQIPSIFLSSIILTYATYEICRRISVLRWMFGLRK